MQLKLSSLAIMAVAGAFVVSSATAAPLLQDNAQQNFQEAYQAFQQAQQNAETPRLELQKLAFASYMRGREYFGEDHINTANLAMNYLFLLAANQRVGEQSYALAALVVRAYQREYDATAIELLDPLLLALETMPEYNEAKVAEYEIAFANVFSALKEKNPAVVLDVKTAMAEELLRLGQSRPELWNSLYKDSVKLHGDEHLLTAKTAFYAAMEDVGQDKMMSAIDKLEQVVAMPANDRAAVLQLQLAANYRLVTFYAKEGMTEGADKALARIGQMNNELNGTTVEQAVYRVNPRYPEDMARAQKEGSVLLKYEIATNGRVENITIVEETNSDFGKSAKEALSQWLFVPAYENGQPVRLTDQQVQLDFALSRSSDDND